MSLVRFQPFREIEALHNEMNRLFERLTVSAPEMGWGGFVPAAELSEDKEAVYLKLELPGLDPKDIDIQVTADTVSIRGERKVESTSEENGIRRSEFRYGSFQRAISLPSEVRNTEAKAEYKDGILHLTLPKVVEEAPKAFKVTLS